MIATYVSFVEAWSRLSEALPAVNLGNFRGNPAEGC